MFWESVQSALVTLTHWEVYAAGLEYMAILWLPMILLYWVGDRFSGFGFLTFLGFILTPFFQAIATLVFVFSIAQIALGFSSDANWSLPFQLAQSAPLGFLKLAGILFLTSIVLSFLPIIGRLASFQTLVLGGFALWMLLGAFDAINHTSIFQNLDMTPDFWFVVGIVVVSSVATTIGTILAAALATIVSIPTGQDSEGFTAIFVVPIASTIGFAPFFIYAAWIGHQIR